LLSQNEGDVWAELAFKALDSTGKGYLTRKEILEMISDQGVMQHHSLDELFKGM
jgi:Ca2+-binding EF-hand superfamily protein